MKKKIFIVNGMARCGKDTFAMLLDEIVPVYKYSSIDKVKMIARLCGWKEDKSEKGRKFLSDLKLLTTEYSDMPCTSIKDKVINFLYNDDEHLIMLIDIREPNEIERAKETFNAETILIKNDRVPFIASNMADANVFNYDYDYVIENSGTIDEFKEQINIFVKENFS